ncbi:PspA/IM30 family protein [Hyphomonadaceae bacterium BL14]|nr:PspA/IM30 family protein [Hyphomonadaceae bacterium BL14]
MSEGLVSRVTRLVSGSVNSIVDTIENAAPETVMREAIREVERAIDDVRAELGLAAANRHHANKRLMETASKHEALAEQLETAVTEGRDDLAEAAIGRQLDLEAQIPVLETALEEASEREAELEGYITALQGRRREMMADLDAFLSSRADTAAPGAAAGAGAGRSGGADARADKAESAFNRVLHGQTGISGSVKADRDTAAKLAELEKISRSNRIRERLAALKASKPE